MEKREPTYIERVAQDIWGIAGGSDAPWYPGEEAAMWLGYAVLALTKGEYTESRDVHEAWSAWAVVAHNGYHRSLVPFDELSPQVQAYDDEYRDAIHAVTRTHGGPKRYTIDDVIADVRRL